MERSPWGRRFEGSAIPSIALVGLFTLAMFVVLHAASSLFLPLTIGILLNLLLSPVVRVLRGWHIPTPLGGVLVVVVTLSAGGLAGYGLASPLKQWMSRAPESLTTARHRLHEVFPGLQTVGRTAERVQQATDSARGNVPAGAPSSGSRAQEVTIRGPSLLSRAFGRTQGLIVHLIEVIALLFFLLAAGDLFLHKLVRVLPQLRDKKKAVQIVRDSQTTVSTFLFASGAIFLVEGALVSLVMWIEGMPTPVLWGAMTFVLEFIPYAGAWVVAAILSLVAFTTFDNLARVMLVPVSFGAINLLQAYFVTPVVLGHRLRLNPVAVLVSLLLWWEIWGVMGAFLAVPILATFKIFCDHIEALAPVGEFLGR